MLLALLLIISGIHLAVRTAVLGKVKQVDYLTGNFSAMMATMCRAVRSYIELIVWPWWPSTQNADYVNYRLSSTWSEPAVLGSLAILVVFLSASAYALRRGMSLVFVGLPFFLLALLPVMNVVPTMQVMAERFAYVPLLGWAMFVTGGVALAQQRSRRWAVIASSLYLVSLGIATNNRLPVWKSEESLFESAYLADETNWRAAANYGQSLLAVGKLEKATEVTSRSLIVSPNNPQLLRLQTNVRAKEGNSTAAIVALREATRRVPQRVVEDWLRLGGALAAQGNFEQAIECFETAAKLAPASPLPWYNLTVMYVRIRNAEQAKHALNELQLREPGEAAFGTSTGCRWA